MSAETCVACGADPRTVGVIDDRLCAECLRREGMEPVTFTDRDFGVGVPGIIAEECYRIRDALHDKLRVDATILSPPRVFTKVGVEARLRVQLDAHLRRLFEQAEPDEETELSLLESMILLRVVKRLKGVS